MSYIPRTTLRRITLEKAIISYYYLLFVIISYLFTILRTLMLKTIPLSECVIINYIEV